MNRVRVMNSTRRTMLGSRVLVADTTWTRLRGLLGRPAPAPGEGLMLVPSRGVHMYGMRYALDVLLLNGSGEVVALFPGLRPGQRTPLVKGAATALEVPVGSIEAAHTRVGDLIVWAPAEPVSVSTAIRRNGAGVAG